MADAPDTTALSDQEWLRQYGVGPNLPPGTVSAVQPPPPTDQSSIRNALTRYGGAALTGAEWAAPVAAGTVGIGALTGGPVGASAALPLAAGELAIGAASGVIGQAVEDIPGAPSWAGPLVGAAVGLTGGGLPTATRTAYNLGSRLFSGPFGGHVALGAGIGVGELGLQILTGATHVSADAKNLVMHGLAALGGTAATLGTGAFIKGARDLLRPFQTHSGVPYLQQALRDWGPAFAGAVGGATGPEQRNALAPSAQNF